MACFVAAGAASGAIEMAEHVGVALYAPVDLRYSAFGTLSAVRSFGRLTATVGATVVWTALGPQWGVLLAAPFMAAAVGVMAMRGPLTGLSIPPRLRAVARLALVALLPVAVVALLIALGLLRVYP